MSDCLLIFLSTRFYVPQHYHAFQTCHVVKGVLFNVALSYNIFLTSKLKAVICARFYCPGNSPSCPFCTCISCSSPLMFTYKCEVSTSCAASVLLSSSFLRTLTNRNGRFSQTYSGFLRKVWILSKTRMAVCISQRAKCANDCLHY